MEKTANFLIPPHKKLNGEEVKLILEKYSLEDITKLPKIKLKDQGLSEIEVVEGDVIEITRTSFVGETKYYRVVVN